MTEREIALDILTEHERTGTYSNVLVRNALDRNEGLTAHQRSFIKRLAEGTIERQIELDGIIRKYQKNPDAKLKIIVRCLLRMSIYQIYYMDSVPDHAACDEAVRILKKHHIDHVTGFVNAVLRSVCREKAAQNPSFATTQKMIRVVRKKPVQNADPVAVLSARYSMPELITRMWTESYGISETEKLLDAMLQVRPVCIRLDERRTVQEQEDVLEKIRALGVQVEQGRWIPYCRYLTKLPCSVAQLPGFAEGIFTVQDESSMLAVEAMGIGSRNCTGAADGAHETIEHAAGAVPEAQAEPIIVYDLCAAPGGKSLHIAVKLAAARSASQREYAAGSSTMDRVYAYDLTRAKTDLIRRNNQRMQCDNITISEFDAATPDPERFGKADYVLCDLPCSGLGVIGRKQDIKYHISQEKLLSLVSLQKKILKTAVQYVKPGGVLLYSTCTIDRAENEKIADYIEKKLGLTPSPLAPYLPETLLVAGVSDSDDAQAMQNLTPVDDTAKISSKGKGLNTNRLQLLPHIHGTDGFFLARFTRT